MRTKPDEGGQPPLLSYFCSEQNSSEGGTATCWPFSFAYVSKFGITLREAASHSACVLNPHSIARSTLFPKVYAQLGQSLGTVVPFTNDKHQPTSASAAAWRGFMRSVYQSAKDSNNDQRSRGTV